MFRSVFRLLALLAIVETVRAKYVCTNETVTVSQNATKADFLFLLDYSPSMCNKIMGVKNGINAFAQKIKSVRMDARFALVVFGGPPTIRLPFVKNIALLADVIETIECDGGGQEASFEAIRRCLPGRNGADLEMDCPVFAGGNVRSSCAINWRNANDTANVIILATDEDSDLPTSNQWYVGSQSQNGLYHKIEPDFSPSKYLYYKGDSKKVQIPYRVGSPLKLGGPFQEEIDQTAEEIVESGVIVHSMISLLIGTERYGNQPVSAMKDFVYQKNAYGNFWANEQVKKNASFVVDDQSVITHQFGDYRLAAQQNDYSKFNRALTLRNLNKKGLGGSLQAKVLDGDGIMRVYNVLDFISDDQIDMINSFFSELVTYTEEIRQSCVWVPGRPAKRSTTSIRTATRVTSATQSTIISTATRRITTTVATATATAVKRTTATTSTSSMTTRRTILVTAITNATSTAQTAASIAAASVTTRVTSDQKINSTSSTKGTSQLPPTVLPFPHSILSKPTSTVTVNADRSFSATAVPTPVVDDSEDPKNPPTDDDGENPTGDDEKPNDGKTPNDSDENPTEVGENPNDSETSNDGETPTEDGEDPTDGENSDASEEYGEPDISEDDLEESSTSESSSPRPTTYSSVVQSTATAGVDDNNNGSNLGSKAGDNTENDTSMIGIAMALVVGLIVVATAVFVNGRRAQSRVRDLHAIIGSRGMTGNRNPLYNTRFSFQSNPMFENPAMHAELTQIETHSHPKMAISSDLGENNTRNDWNMFATLNNQGKTWHSSGSISGGANNSLNNNKMPGSSGSMNGDKFNTGSGQL